MEEDDPPDPFVLLFDEMFLLLLLLLAVVVSPFFLEDLQPFISLRFDFMSSIPLSRDLLFDDTRSLRYCDSDSESEEWQLMSASSSSMHSSSSMSSPISTCLSQVVSITGDKHLPDCRAE